MTKELIAAINAAKLAGKHTRKHFGELRSSQIRAKDVNDFVTTIDKQSEEIIVNFLTKRFPNDEIFAEEGSVRKGSSGRTWIIDPLDGTLNYIHNIHFYSISIALVGENDELLVGTVYQPILKELFTAERGGGAYFNNRRVRVSRNYKAQQAFFATGFPYKLGEHVDTYFELFKEVVMETAGVRRPGSAALDLAYTACGKFDGFWEMNLHAWDIAAGALIVKEAGGIVTDFKGDNGFLDSGHIIATNGKLHGWLLEKVQKQFGMNFE
jgi:myo-inositol-1(or 4)-monophosphatase